MTEERFLEVKANGIEKWQEAVKQPEEDELYVDWWVERGRTRCMFCYRFKCVYNCTFEICFQSCPLDDGHCADEWHAIDTNFRMNNRLDYSVFIQNAKAMLKRIESLEYNPEWGYIDNFAKEDTTIRRWQAAGGEIYNGYP